MPYIITSKAACPDCKGRGRLYDRIGKYDRVCNRCSLGDIPTSRTAVATLDEARETAHQIAGASGVWVKVRPHVWDAKGLPEAGGTVGPLPDGTVIEVKRVLAAPELARATGIPRGDWFYMSDAAIVAEYNRTTAA